MYNIGILTVSEKLFKNLKDSLPVYQWYIISDLLNSETLLNVDLLIVDFDSFKGQDLSVWRRSMKSRSIPTILVGKYVTSEIVEKWDPTLIFSTLDMLPLQHATKRILEDPILEEGEELLRDSMTDGLFLKDGSKYIRLNYSDLLFLQADGNYVVVQTKERKYVVRFSLKKSSGVLHAHTFIQIHRNYIVNYRLIDEVDIENNIVRIDMYELSVGRAFKGNLKNSLLALQ